MPTSEALKRVWRWKDEIYRDIKDMTTEQRQAYFKQAASRLADKTGKKLNLPRHTKHQDTSIKPQNIP